MQVAETRFQKEDDNVESVTALFEYLGKYYKNPERKKFFSDMMKKVRSLIIAAEENLLLVFREPCWPNVCQKAGIAA